MEKEITTKTDYDVIVAGAGPAGLSVASELARLGHKVLIVEKNEAGQSDRAWFVAGSIIEQLEPGAQECTYGGVKRILEYRSSEGGINLCWEIIAPWEGSPEWKRYPFVDTEKMLQYWVDVTKKSGSDVKSKTSILDYTVKDDIVSVKTVSTEKEGEYNIYTAKMLIDATGYSSQIAKMNNISREGYFWWSVYGFEIEVEDVTKLKHCNGENMRVGDFMLWQSFGDVPMNSKHTLEQLRPIMEYEVLDDKTIFAFILYFASKTVDFDYMKNEYNYILLNMTEENIKGFRTGTRKKERYGYYPSNGLSQSVAVDRVAFVGDAGCWTTPAGYGMAFILQNYKQYSRNLSELIKSGDLTSEDLNSITKFNDKKEYEILMDKLTLHFLAYADPSLIDRFTMSIYNALGGKTIELMFILQLSSKDVAAILKVVLKNFKISELAGIFRTDEDKKLMLQVAVEFGESEAVDAYLKLTGQKPEEAGYEFDKKPKSARPVREFVHNIVHDIYNGIRNIGVFKNFFTSKKTMVQLPEDDGFVEKMDIQWWYWTGHLEDEDKKRYGFELTIFAFDSWIFFKDIIAQAAVTDLSSSKKKENKFVYNEKVSYFKLPKKLKSKFELYSKNKNGYMSAIGGNGEDVLEFAVSDVVDGKKVDYELKLNLKELFQPTIHYGGKLHEYEYGGNTFYYARENMKTTGTIKIDGVEKKVSGTSWFDRQYGELWQSIFKGWQWFAIEVAGESIMLYNYAEQNERFGSITKGDKSEEFNGDKFEVKILGHWKSPHTEIDYPSGWEVKVKNRKYFVRPAKLDQELCADHFFWVGPEYWEGSCTVYDERNVEVGKAYVELNGFGHKLFTIEADGEDIGV